MSGMAQFAAGPGACVRWRVPTPAASTKVTLTMDHKRQIKQFVLKNYLFTDDMSALADDESLIRNGTIDSTGMLELVFHLEETWPIKVVDEEMVPDNFETIDAITAFVTRKLG